MLTQFMFLKAKKKQSLQNYIYCSETESIVYSKYKVKWYGGIYIQ